MVKTPTTRLVVCCCIHTAHQDPPPISSSAIVTQHPITHDAFQDARGGNMCLELTAHDHVFVYLNYSLSSQVNGAWVIRPARETTPHNCNPMLRHPWVACSMDYRAWRSWIGNARAALFLMYGVSACL